ncbi:MAG: dihydroxy-acid dehydratase, partial [Candidatus Methylacidiphilales bacterium]
MPSRPKSSASSATSKGKSPRAAHRQYSAPMIDGPERAPSRAMLYPVGFKKIDFQKSQIGIASTWSMVTPCNM